MNEKKQTGGPAFPFIDSSSPLEHPGMTLRDYFAAKAMEAVLTTEMGSEFTFSERAEWAYEQADAMLEARNEQN